MKTILITGTSSGIGKATAKLMAEKGYRVYATMRTPEKEQELNHVDGITLMKLDVTDAEQIKTIAEKVIYDGGIDILFNNAGYGMKGALELVPDKSIRELFETDVFGTIHLMQAFIPYFKQKKSGLILSTTSLAGVVSFPLDSIYNCAKRGLEGLSEALYYELRPYGVKVKLIVPGAIKTNFKVNEEIFDVGAYAEASQNLTKMLIPDFDKFPTSEEAADVVLQAVEDESDQLRYWVGDAAVKLYQKRQELGLEEYKHYFYDLLFTKD